MNTLRQALGAVTVDWWANLFVFSATVLIANLKPVTGFCISIIGQILFIVYGIKCRKRSFVVFNILYMFNSFIGIARWTWAG